MNNKNGFIVANWKMNFTAEEVSSFFKEFVLPTNCSHQISIAPQAALLPLVKNYTDKLHIFLAAQNCSSESKGAFTGEVSAATLQSVGATQVILGHSERRQFFAENEELLSKKIEQALNAKLKVIYCIGETLAQRSTGQLESTLIRQLIPLSIFKNHHAWQNLILAYEPVWAIGTGQVATLDQVNHVHQYLVDTFKATYPQVPLPPILYGGSVNASNAQELFNLANVSGFLVGGASLKPKDFAVIASVQ
jgi:triosephosphate isomerase